jgi:hypothetical protein
MTSTDKRLNDVYTNLCNIVRNPYEYGLGRRVPEPLSKALEEALCMLAQIQTERIFADERDPVAELSQDAGRSSSKSSVSKGGSTKVEVSEFCTR